MGGGPPSFPQGFPCPVVLWYSLAPSGFRLRACHALWGSFPNSFGCPSGYTVGCPQPRRARTTVWAPSRSLAATWEIDVSFFSSAYLDVSVQRLTPAWLWIYHAVHRVFLCGFPHSDIPGSMDICSSPGLFAACHVLLRLLVPRHPPCALLRFNYCIYVASHIQRFGFS